MVVSPANIAEKVYQHIVNGKSAIEWIMEHYAATTHKESGIKNDHNDWTIEHNNPRYILDLLLSVIALSIKTVDIVAGLQKVERK
jgi:predicted helicase